MTVMTKSNKRSIKKSTPTMEATVEAVLAAAGDAGEPEVLQPKLRRKQKSFKK